MAAHVHHPSSVTPKLVRSQLESKRKNEVLAVVHQAAVVCLSYKEFAEFTKLALAKHLEEGDWCVAVTRSLYFQSRGRSKAMAVLSVPCLLADLPADGRPIKKHAFTVLLWRCAGDETRTVGSAEMRVGAEGGVDPTASPTTTPGGDPSTTSPAPAVSGGVATPSPQLAPLGYRQLSTSIGGESEVRCVSRLMGGAQRSVGLSALTEGAFCKSLRDALTAQYGSTWHVLLGSATAASAKAVADAEGGARLVDSGSARKAGRREEEGGRRGGDAAADGRALTVEDRLGAARVTPSAHAPAFSATCAPGHYFECTLAPHWPTGKDAAPPPSLSRTPPLYHVAAFRTLPGMGEASVEDSTSVFPGWDGTFAALLRLWAREPITALRTVAYAAAAACFLAFGVLAYRYDNRCARLKGLGLAGSPTAASPGVLGVGEAPSTQDSDYGSDFTGPLRLRSAAALWKEVSSFGDLLLGVVLGRDLRPVQGGVDTLPALELDKRLPPLPDVPDWGGEEGWGAAPNPLAALLDLPDHCTRVAVLLADRRMLRARALMYAALACGAIAVLLRRVQLAREAAQLKGAMKGLVDLVPRREAAAGAGGKGGKTKAA